MLCINNYPKNYIDECHTKMEEQLSTYNILIAEIKKQSGTNETQLNAAIESFEPVFFNNLVMVLDNYFSDRSRTLELKDGNPANEVRMICNSIMKYDSILSADNSIKYDPVKSVLKYKFGEEIKLNKTNFLLLYTAYFADIEKKYL